MEKALYKKVDTLYLNGLIGGINLGEQDETALHYGYVPGAETRLYTKDENFEELIKLLRVRAFNRICIDEPIFRIFRKVDYTKPNLLYWPEGVVFAKKMKWEDFKSLTIITTYEKYPLKFYTAANLMRNLTAPEFLDLCKDNSLKI